MAKREIKKYTLADIKDRYIGKEGSEERHLYEYELRMDVLGHLIKAARKERKLTQLELGKLVGVQKAQISKIENNINNSTIATVLKVFEALDADVRFNVRLEGKNLEAEHI
ncbi:DNA-binding transcriptional regulator, XRE-family HTH domain [Chryseobacterium shigense]|uniref:DNA-binding transcriptional regulator, XRE-family HTH domain n=1 Tax=Chryseobacterium shigense TaxID=297244 RepID=A0A1N7IGD2_9FLAO|nr:helix-turn-helix transcriptional regulator [Chryseobacterium shigense]SIS36174.1 DNA-binding transcriptional regulator, XRE-family HTH domain [Chryseobacterium shigense]